MRKIYHQIENNRDMFGFFQEQIRSIGVKSK